MKRFALTIAAFTAALSLNSAPVAAQSTPASTNPYLGANITRTYNITDLKNRPGLLTLGKGDVVMLDFDAEIDAVITPDGAKMDIPEPLGNLLVITGKVSNGMARIVVRLVDGQDATFIINFTPGGNGMKRIRVVNTPRLDYAQPTTTNIPQAQVITTTQPIYNAPVISGGQVHGASNTQAPSYDLSRFNTTPLTPLTRTQPSWLEVNSTLTQQSGTGVNTATVSIKNGGTRTLRLSGKDLVLSADGKALNVNMDSNIQVDPGETRTLTINLTETVTAGAVIAVEWLAYDPVTVTYYRIGQR